MPLPTAAPGTHFEVIGEDTIARGLAEVGRELLDVEGTNRTAAELVADAARGNAPVLTGELQGSITVEAARESGQVVVGVPYAGVAEFGYAAMNREPHPYLVPALEENEDRVFELYADKADDAIGKVKGA